MTASCPGLSASTSIPKMSCVFGPSLIWNRGSAVVSVESISSTRPSSGAALFAAGNEIAKRAPAASGSARSCGGRDDAATRASGRPAHAAASCRVVMEAPLAVEQWWAADGVALLHLPREREDALLAERLADDLEAHGQASRVQATGHRRHRQPGETQHERGGDPIHVRLHLLPGDRCGIVLLDGEGRHRHAGRHEVVEPLEQLAEQVPQTAARRLGGGELAGRRPEPGLHVVGDVGAEAMQLVESGMHLCHEPQAAQRQERGACEREVELDDLHARPELLQRARRPAAHVLDHGVDADPGDVGTVCDPQARRDAGRDGTNEIPPPPRPPPRPPPPPPPAPPPPPPPPPPPRPPRPPPPPPPPAPVPPPPPCPHPCPLPR